MLAAVLMRGPCVSALISAALAVAGCDDLFGSRYDAEVGYRAGTETRWEIWGNFSSLDDCRNAAIGRYNFYFSQQRAVSWACLKKSDGGYASRHR